MTIRIMNDSDRDENVTTYIGDGAYVKINGEGFSIFTSNGVEVHDEVFVDMNHVSALRMFLDKYFPNRR